jgi:hypothetical protein
MIRGPLYKFWLWMPVASLLLPLLDLSLGNGTADALLRVYPNLARGLIGYLFLYGMGWVVFRETRALETVDSRRDSELHGKHRSLSFIIGMFVMAFAALAMVVTFRDQ